jgi:hypothetical protein
MRSAFACTAPERAGVRLSSLPVAPELYSPSGLIGALPASVLGPEARPVRAIFFDKSDRTNWSLDWHQDRVICIQKRVHAPGFEQWTLKSGLLHVSPPFELLAKMVTLRVHLDDVDDENAPLIIAPGSHRLGKVAEKEIVDAVRRCGSHNCLARAGDVWLYSTPIIHASSTAVRPRRRRVLQLDYAAFDLPHGLRWHQLN